MDEEKKEEMDIPMEESVKQIKQKNKAQNI